MIKSRKDYKYYLDCDKKALGIKQGEKLSHSRKMIYRFQVLLRKNEYLHNCKIGVFLFPLRWLINRIFNSFSIKLGFSIPINCFDEGLSIAHIGTIVVNGAAHIGKNCRIHTCVNIGTAAGFGNQCPQIGDNVYIGPGAKIFGNITIGNYVAIGANSVVNKSFESGVTIAGVPARVVSQKGTSDIIKL